VATASNQLGRQLDQGDWSPYFDGINNRVEGGADIDVTVEVVSDEVRGTEAEHLPLDGITWEDEDDEIAIGLGGRGQRYPAALWHFVDEPRKVWVQEESDRPTALTIESEDGTRTLVSLYF
jgi:hypothetical protein